MFNLHQGILHSSLEIIFTIPRTGTTMLLNNVHFIQKKQQHIQSNFHQKKRQTFPTFIPKDFISPVEVPSNVNTSSCNHQVIVSRKKKRKIYEKLSC